MKLKMLGAVLSTLLSTSAIAESSNVIHVSCYRGPWTDVIWDYPMVTFTDDLEAYGYTPERALAIATSVCRDASLIDPVNGENLEGMKAKTQRLMLQYPPNAKK